MKGEEVLKLIDAGFSAEEIRAMSSDKEDPPADTSTPKDESVASETKVTETATETPEAFKALNDTVKTLNDTVKALQEKNVKNASMESPMDSVNKNINDFLNSL